MRLTPVLRIPELVAAPEGDGPFPGLILLSEAWGLDDHIARLASQLAAAGFLTAAPDLLAGRGSRRAIRDALRGEGSAFAQVDEAAEWLAGEPRSDPSRMGVLGLSMGATMALRLALSGRFQVAGLFYGLTPKGADWSRCCPVVASFGEKDRLIRDQGRALAKNLERAGVENDVKCYKLAKHSFLTEAKPGWQTTLLGLRYDPFAAADAWQRSISFLKRHLSIPS